MSGCMPSGSVVTSVSNVFDSAGINQTRHQIMLNIKSTVSVIIPGYITSVPVETNMCIAESVIVGLVPDTYANVQLDGGLLGGSK